MDAAAVSRVRDLGDVVRGSSSLRGHAVADVAVDGFWPALAVAAIVTDGRDPAVRARQNALAAAWLQRCDGLLAGWPPTPARA